MGTTEPRLGHLLALALLLFVTPEAFAHAVTQGDKGYIQEISGVHLLPFAYLGAKHMMTGYDHILFLFGVIFFLYKLKHIAVYVSLFAIGHSTTMVLGVYYNIGLNSYLIDAVIGFSVVYKALDNLGAPALVRGSAQHQGCHSGLWLDPRLWPGHQDPGVRNLA